MPHREVGDPRCAAAVDLKVVHGVSRAQFHARLGRQVIDDLGLELFEDSRRLVRMDVDFVELDVLRDVRPPAGGQVVEYPDIVARRDIRFDNVGTDEPGPASDKDPHQNLFGALCARF